MNLCISMDLVVRGVSKDCIVRFFQCTARSGVLG